MWTTAVLAILTINLISHMVPKSSSHIPGVNWIESRKMWKVYQKQKYVGCCKPLAEGDDAKRTAWDLAIAMLAKKLGIWKPNLLNSMQASQSSQSVLSTCNRTCYVGVVGRIRSGSTKFQAQSTGRKYIGSYDTKLKAAQAVATEAV